MTTRTIKAAGGPATEFSQAERTVTLVAVATVGAAGLLWAAGQLAARVTIGTWLDADPSTMLRVAFGVARQPTDPAAAFGASAGAAPGPVAYWTAVAVLLALLLGAIVLAGRRWAARPSNEPTPARWATRADLKPLIVKRPTPGRITLGRARGKLLAAEPGHSLLVMGPTQSGKTSGLAIPAIREWHGPVVATSVKSDLLDDTYTTRTAAGDVWVFDPTNTIGGLPTATWSPLTGCHTWQGALQTANWLTESARTGQLQDSDFWFANAAKLLAPLLFAASISGRTMADVVRWVDLQETKQVQLELELAGVEDAIAAFQATRTREERARSSVYTTAETILRTFADPQVAESTATSEIDPDRLLDGGHHTLYVAAPIHEQARLRPLFSALIQTTLRAAYQHAAHHGRLDPPLLLVFDEAANIAPIRDLAQIASTAAGLGIQLVTIWQDRAQIDHRYGRAANTVINNHRAKLALAGITDSTTTRDFAATIGDTEVLGTSATTDADGRTSRTRAEQLRPLASAAALRQLRPFEGVLLYGQLPPTDLALRLSE